MASTVSVSPKTLFLMMALCCSMRVSSGTSSSFVQPPVTTKPLSAVNGKKRNPVEVEAMTNFQLIFFSKYNQQPKNVSLEAIQTPLFATYCFSKLHEIPTQFRQNRCEHLHI